MYGTIVVVDLVVVDIVVVEFPGGDTTGGPGAAFGCVAVAAEEPFPFTIIFAPRCRLTLWHDFPTDFSTALPDEMSSLMRLQLYLDQPHLANCALYILGLVEPGKRYLGQPEHCRPPVTEKLGAG